MNPDQKTEAVYDITRAVDTPQSPVTSDSEAKPKRSTFSSHARVVSRGVSHVGRGVSQVGRGVVQGTQVVREGISQGKL